MNPRIMACSIMGVWIFSLLDTRYPSMHQKFFLNTVNSTIDLVLHLYLLYSWPWTGTFSFFPGFFINQLTYILAPFHFFRSEGNYLLSIHIQIRIHSLASFFYNFFLVRRDKKEMERWIKENQERKAQKEEEKHFAWWVGGALVAFGLAFSGEGSTRNQFAGLDVPGFSFAIGLFQRLYCQLCVCGSTANVWVLRGVKGMGGW